VFFFFSSRRRHTRFKCDWSSDVCSSDLFVPVIRTFCPPVAGAAKCANDRNKARENHGSSAVLLIKIMRALQVAAPEKERILAAKIGRASCRERVEIKEDGEEDKEEEREQ